MNGKLRFDLRLHTWQLTRHGNGSEYDTQQSDRDGTEHLTINSRRILLYI